MHFFSLCVIEQVIAKRKEDSGKVKVLLHWTPEDMWVYESALLTSEPFAKCQPFIWVTGHMRAALHTDAAKHTHMCARTYDLIYVTDWWFRISLSHINCLKNAYRLIYSWLCRYYESQKRSLAFLPEACLCPTVQRDTDECCAKSRGSILHTMHCAFSFTNLNIIV